LCMWINWYLLVNLEVRLCSVASCELGAMLLDVFVVVYMLGVWC